MGRTARQRRPLSRSRSSAQSRRVGTSPAVARCPDGQARGRRRSPVMTFRAGGNALAVTSVDEPVPMGHICATRPPGRRRRSSVPQRHQPCQIRRRLATDGLLAGGQVLGLRQHQRLRTPLPPGPVAHRQLGRADPGVYVPSTLLRQRPFEHLPRPGAEERAKAVAQSTATPGPGHRPIVGGARRPLAHRAEPLRPVARERVEPHPARPTARPVRAPRQKGGYRAGIPTLLPQCGPYAGGGWRVRYRRSDSRACFPCLCVRPQLDKAEASNVTGRTLSEPGNPGRISCVRAISSDIAASHGRDEPLVRGHAFVSVETIANERMADNMPP